MEKRLLLFTSLVLFLSMTAWAQRTVTGTVIDDLGEPLIGANVLEVGTSNGTITDIDGKYSIDVQEGASLQFSLIGYNSQTVEVGAESMIDITLQEGVQLDEVVVTALGIEREKKALGYSVTEVSGEEFTEARELNVANALSGKIAGVNVSNIASGPAGSSRVIIRGNSSLTGNNQPLYVIDGIPIDNSNLGNAGMWGGTDWGDGVSSINPDDIETMSVLKGNTAAALYGSRASNGVILITTKSGSKRKGIGVDFSTNYTFENIINTYNELQRDYGSGNRGLKPVDQAEALDYTLSGWGAPLDGSQVVQWDGVARPYSAVDDNVSRFYQTGKTWTNTLGLSGGNEIFNFRLGVTNLQNEGVNPNSGLDRNTFTTKVSAKFADRLTATMSGSFISEDVSNRPRLSDAPGNPNYLVWNLAPNLNVEDMKGPNGDGSNEDNIELETDNSIYVTNPYWAAYRYDFSDKKDRLFGNFSLRYDFTDWLYLMGRIGIDTYRSRRRELDPYGTAFIINGRTVETNRTFTETNMDFLLGFDKQFGMIGVNAFVGGNQMDQKRETLGTSGSEFAVPFLEVVTNGKNQSLIYDIAEQAINSLYGSLELSYGNYLYLTATARNDWFSTLSNINVDGEDNSILYPSVGLSFVFSDAFKMRSDVLSFGKLRASWAQVGGGTDPYQLSLPYALFGQGHLGNPLGRLDPPNGRIPNSSLVPLTNTEIEVGLDLRFFQNRLGVDFAYYDRKTEDDILFASITQTAGYGSQVVNVGQVKNKGVELLLTINPVRTPSFRWDATVNFANNQSEVVSLLDPTNDDLAGTNDAEGISQGEARSQNAYIYHKEGYPYGVIMGFEYARDDNGNIELDANGLPMQGNFAVLGNGVHPTSIGLTNSFSYKNISFSFLLDSKWGGDLYSGTNMTLTGAGLHSRTLEGRTDGQITLADGGKTTLEPQNVQDYYSRITGITEEWVYDADFIKLRQFQLGYRLPSSMLKNTPFAGVSISLVGRNLLLLYSKVDNIDPESTYSNDNAQGLEWFGAPQSRSFGFDLNVKF
ncbi:MAG: SusC/RagA family TonB-linked outer membrane protein [Phaeodactylibacter sp.]|nr:SusC/RagA family TonB-linked outer membrane protein [Phaeodactylibacter sp.]MCB9265196.1 SusC/RagA family TonB-linked outer membrane protein [Lewinellaceae bacterium]MCB9285942.1 SusC/RagA family TonB-linked outer membrane protein [Lewinellaceae bacterium]